MSSTVTFDPRKTRYKTPYGAVPSGTRVELTLRPPRAEGFSRAILTARLEAAGETREIPMPWTGTDRGEDTFSCALETGNYVGLIWYSFRLEGFGGRERALGPYQLTVYDGSETVPDWFGQGLCYQIFPDRFFRLSVPDPAGMVGGRTVHEIWEEEPDYLPAGQTIQGKDICNRDFFGGSLAGIAEKLDRLQDMGVETLYLCPIFEAAENHRYGTADYHAIDPMLGTLAEFEALCRAAHRRGMRILLDGVFSHTGYTSRYFNADGFYPDPGAAQRQDSPYFSWYRFNHWPDDYDSWWGIYSLPAVDKTQKSYQDFIYGGEDSVVRRWLRAGADGWRLDVADELPDEFVAGIHAAARAEKPDAVVIGEVWEDGSNKIAYGVRRRHLLGRHLDGLMNYPFRNALIAFLLGGDAAAFREEMETLREHYPPFAFSLAMNALGTHDTLRILTCLGTGSAELPGDKAHRAQFRLSPQQRAHGMALLKLAACVLFAFPGAPTVYYGDEAGMEGYEDPFNRRTYPWGREDAALLVHNTALGRLRRESAPLRRGALHWGTCRGTVLSFAREWAGQWAACTVNAGAEEARASLPWGGGPARDLFTGAEYLPRNGSVEVPLPPLGYVMLTGEG